MLPLLESLFSYIFLLDIRVYFIEVHKLCAAIFSESELAELNQALICGTHLKNSEWKETLSKAGLLHLLVVSGYHLGILKIVLNYISNWIPLSRSIQIALLTGYSVITGWQPPVVRSLLELLCLFRFKEHISIIASWILSLVLHPNWAGSLSLHLSILARSAIFVSSRKSLFFANTLIVLSLLPLISFHNPLITFFTLLISPVLLLALALNAFFELITINFDFIILIWVEKINQKLIFLCLDILDAFSSMFSPFEKQRLIKNATARIFYVSCSLVILYFIGTNRFQDDLKRVQKTIPVSFTLWSLFFFIILILQPIACK